MEGLALDGTIPEGQDTMRDMESLFLEVAVVTKERLMTCESSEDRSAELILRKDARAKRDEIGCKWQLASLWKCYLFS